MKKKLRLNKETISKLSSHAMSQMKGGYATYEFYACGGEQTIYYGCTDTFTCGCGNTVTTCGATEACTNGCGGGGGGGTVGCMTQTCQYCTDIVIAGCSPSVDTWCP